MEERQGDDDDNGDNEDDDGIQEKTYKSTCMCCILHLPKELPIRSTYRTDFFLLFARKSEKLTDDLYLERVCVFSVACLLVSRFGFLPLFLSYRSLDVIKTGCCQLEDVEEVCRLNKPNKPRRLGTGGGSTAIKSIERVSSGP